MKKKAQKLDFRFFWTHFEVLHKKQSSEFMIPACHDYLFEPKITKCGDLLYNYGKQKIIVIFIIKKLKKKHKFLKK